MEQMASVCRQVFFDYGFGAGTFFHLPEEHMQG